MKIKTSLTDPLRIATIRPPRLGGYIGVTLCPGKYQMDALSGNWQRDINQDLDAIARWGACLVVSVIEMHELQALRVPCLPEEVLKRGMAWRHLSIPDRCPPDAEAEEIWPSISAECVEVLGRSRNVLFHCKGGLGRSGTMAARLLMDLGMAAKEAIGAVRAERRGAIETEGQFDYLVCTGAGIRR